MTKTRNRLESRKVELFFYPLLTDFLEWGLVVEEIKELKGREGQDIIAYGSATFVSNLIRHGLIDEYHLFVSPVAIGNEMTIFRELNSKQNLKLVQSKAFDCGIVVLNYEPKHE